MLGIGLEWNNVKVLDDYALLLSFEEEYSEASWSPDPNRKKKMQFYIANDRWGDELNS